MSAATRTKTRVRAKAAARAKPASPTAKPVAATAKPVAVKKAAVSRRPPAKPTPKPVASRKPTPSPVIPVRAAPAADLQDVTFTVRAERGSDVFVAGSFNDWDPTRTRLTWDRSVYAVTVRLAKGRYEYKFVIDGTWCMDPECPDWVPNGFGSLNSVVTVE